MGTDEALEFVGELLRADRDQIIGGFCRGFSKLDAASRAAVLAEMAEACRSCFLRRADLPPGLDLEGLLKRVCLAGPGRVEIQRDGNEITWSELSEGQCSCPLVRLGVIPLDPKLCACAVEWTKGLVERFHGGDVAVELVESVASGSQSCVFRVKLAGRPKQST